MWYPQNGSIAIGSRRTMPCLPVAAAVVSLASVAPRNTPCAQLNDCITRGTVFERRPPKMMALIGTPCGSFTCDDSIGLFDAGAVKREFGCAAFSVEPFFHGRPCQSVSSSGVSPSRPSHQTRMSFVTATFVNSVFFSMHFIAFGFDEKFVPGATPK